MSEPVGYEEIRAETVMQAARTMAGAAMTAPKSGGMLFLKGSPVFLETVIVEDHETLKRLADWMRARGRERQETIWFRDAEVAEAVDAVLFVGLADWYPPLRLWRLRLRDLRRVSRRHEEASRRFSRARIRWAALQLARH